MTEHLVLALQSFASSLRSSRARISKNPNRQLIATRARRIGSIARCGVAPAPFVADDTDLRDMTSLLLGYLLNYSTPRKVGTGYAGIWGYQRMKEQEEVEMVFKRTCTSRGSFSRRSSSAGLLDTQKLELGWRCQDY